MTSREKIYSDHPLLVEITGHTNTQPYRFGRENSSELKTPCFHEGKQGVFAFCIKRNFSSSLFQILRCRQENIIPGGNFLRVSRLRPFRSHRFGYA